MKCVCNSKIPAHDVHECVFFIYSVSYTLFLVYFFLVISYVREYMCVRYKETEREHIGHVIITKYDNKHTNDIHIHGDTHRCLSKDWKVWMNDGYRSWIYRFYSTLCMYYHLLQNWKLLLFLSLLCINEKMEFFVSYVNKWIYTAVLCVCSWCNYIFMCHSSLGFVYFSFY